MGIRDLDPRETAALIRLWEECGLTRPWNDPRRDIADALACPTSTVLIIEQEDRIVGSAMVGFDGHRGWVYYLAVAPDRRGRGHGRQLMKAAERWLIGKGAPKIQFMVRDGNQTAEAFYRALGYETQAVSVLGRRLDGPKA